jgi:hypothetical protein
MRAESHALRWQDLGKADEQPPFAGTKFSIRPMLVDRPSSDTQGKVTAALLTTVSVYNFGPRRSQ